MFIVRSCCHLMNSTYADGREINDECGNTLEDIKCQDVKDCPFKQVAEHLLRVVNSQVCNRCDGVGYDGGCMDKDCGTYVAHKCLDLLDVEFIDE